MKTSAICLQRSERKFQVDMSRTALPALLEEISNYIPLQEYVPGQGTTHNNTFYFDSEDCSLLKQGLRSRYDHFRVRARRYEYDDAGAAGPHFWLELKTREGDIRRKDRLSLAPSDLIALMAGAPLPQRICRDNGNDLSADACRKLYAKLQTSIVQRGLQPLLLVRYERTAFDNGVERLSIDSNIRYRAAGRSDFEVLSLKDLPAAHEDQEPAIVMELKYTGELPLWINEVQRKFPVRSINSFSKCDRGMKRLLEGPLRARADASALLDLMRTCKQESAAFA